MGQGQADEAVRLLSECAAAGTWLCLKARFRPVRLLIC